MKKNRIVVFNRVTCGDKLDVVSVFENLAGSHFDQFCLLYDIISSNHLIDYIDDIFCKIGKNEITFNAILNTFDGKKIKHEMKSITKNEKYNEVILSLKDETQIIISVPLV